MNSAQEIILHNEMQYSEYAPHYDNLCAINPAYQDLIALFSNSLEKLCLPSSPVVCDLGAGTGNFVCQLLTQIPMAKVTHLDPSPEMNTLASGKYAKNGFEVNIVESSMEDWEFEDDSLDLVVCVNALNNAPPVMPMLKKICRWLKPGGSIFLVNFGREIKILDWTWFLLKNSLKNRGAAETVRSIYQTRKAFSSNRAGRGDQKSGRLWTHTSDELSAIVEAAGFEIREFQTCYRDYADLVLATKPNERSLN
ncbi:MAG: class I SAM-dependent methyltransferase [Pseudomonadaceae bacterium]|nr:class I SAM-dependent methyltransferase [Pseudomonadaceae bacterium]